MSGTSGRASALLSANSVSAGCPCGRPHWRPTVRRRRGRASEEAVASECAAAVLRGEAQPGQREPYSLDYSGDCLSPISVPASVGRVFANRKVRCRTCSACLRAKRNYWGFAAMNQTIKADAAGRRSWFGTFTMNLVNHEIMLSRAKEASGEVSADWWSEPHCDERFRLVCDEFHREVRKYFRRLRHRGCRFRYFLVYERHKSGLPHAHFILHEDGEPIRKKVLRSEWPWGFFQCSLIGGRARHAAAPEKAAWYAVKYLTKSRQARVKASPGYRPVRRSKSHSVSV